MPAFVLRLLGVVGAAFLCVSGTFLIKVDILPGAEVYVETVVRAMGGAMIGVGLIAFGVTWWLADRPPPD